MNRHEGSPLRPVHSCRRHDGAGHENPHEADALYDRAVTAQGKINTEYDGIVVPFSFADGFGYKATVNLVGVVIDRTTSELGEIIGAAQQEAHDAAREKHGRSKVGI